MELNGNIYIDFFNKLEKRGFYTCRTLECIDKLTVKTVKNSLKTSNDITLNKNEILDTLKKNLFEQLISGLRISKKAGCLIATQDAFVKAAKENMKFSVIFLAKDISDNSFKKVKNLLNLDATYEKFFSKSEMGEIAGRNYANLIGVVESELGRKILRLLETIENIFEGACCNGNGNEKNS